ncbi:ABC transporter ATP-binding protein [Ktedonosporobacter rubrisoli]|uniref:ABC transporter ATP-binding protein n=1 Tax=Ktedonosporobacter rubrisoli TaxID=2509675 RepID=A0A4P6JHP5_KTERU|nr:ABC transporter ATP-binding protein [Ktedonosporobacter rubrisoli]QBD74537.1 ABC transporter ATP-binding protein [Ktedonosporobacter rubrisoli]
MGQQDSSQIVRAHHVYLNYGPAEARREQPSAIVEDANFSIQAGEKFVIIGPSGCGKTTLLKALGGFLQPLQGEILLKGQTIKQPGPDRAFVFQDFEQLFAWRTVQGNIVYALQAAKRVPKSQAIERARHYLELVQVLGAADKYPHQLSGGMKQRAALARALALEPDILLMDEPFGALDAITRNQLQLELNEIWKRTGVTLVMVTHSIQEAVFLGTHVMVMSASPGRVREIVDTSQAEEFGTSEFDEVSKYLRSQLIRRELSSEQSKQLSAVE